MSRGAASENFQVKSERGTHGDFAHMSRIRWSETHHFCFAVVVLPLARSRGRRRQCCCRDAASGLGEAVKSSCPSLRGCPRSSVTHVLLIHSLQHILDGCDRTRGLNWRCRVGGGPGGHAGANSGRRERPGSGPGVPLPQLVGVEFARVALASQCRP